MRGDPATFAIHALPAAHVYMRERGDRHVGIFERLDPFKTGELAVPLPVSGLPVNRERDDRCS